MNLHGQYCCEFSTMMPGNSSIIAYPFLPQWFGTCFTTRTSRNTALAGTRSPSIPVVLSLTDAHSGRRSTRPLTEPPVRPPRRAAKDVQQRVAGHDNGPRRLGERGRARARKRQVRKLRPRPLPIVFRIAAMFCSHQARRSWGGLPDESGEARSESQPIR
jgi:hypothetical protein